jgi:hypothetical protein
MSIATQNRARIGTMKVTNKAITAYLADGRVVSVPGVY